MKIQIYGSGCRKCESLAANAEAAAQAIGVAYQLEKVTDMNAIIDAGVMRTPALAVDGRVLVEGKVVGADEIRRLMG